MFDSLSLFCPFPLLSNKQAKTTSRKWLGSNSEHVYMQPSLVILFWEVAGAAWGCSEDRSPVGWAGEAECWEQLCFDHVPRQGCLALCAGLRVSEGGWVSESVHMAALLGSLLWMWVSLASSVEAEEDRSGHGTMSDVYCNMCVQRGDALCGPSGDHGFCRKCSHGRTSKQTSWSLMEKVVLVKFDFRLNLVVFLKYKKSNTISLFFVYPAHRYFM